MSGGRRKSRKPQKWEDYVADEEQLATIEKELEKEEKARMQNVDNDKDNAEEVEDMNKSDDETTDEEAQLEIVIQKDEGEEKLKTDKIAEEENYEVTKGVTVKEDQEEEENFQPSISGGSGQMIGDCTTCGIQLRDWSSTHNHLRFHRLSHVPECIYKVITPLSRRIVCQVCQRSCQNKEVLAYHAYTEHYINHKDAKICPFCSMSFKGMEEFQEHLDIDIISFKCQMCGVSVNQEHRFYQHTVCCTKKHQLGITSLPCCICGITTTLSKLYSHLMKHSTLLSLPRHLAHNNKRSCELCGRSGFLNDEFLIRHCILRCSQRNNLQVSFAVIVSNYAKNQNMGFTETLSCSAMHTYLKLGIEAWGTPLCVKQYLEALQTSNKPPGHSVGNRRDAAEFTDVQLLEYLDRFEEETCEHDKELEFLLNFKSKVVDGSHLEIIPSVENMSSSNQVDMKPEVLLASSLYTNSSLETSSSNTSNNCQIDFSRLMQHLRRSSDKRTADEEGGEGGQIDICLVTSTTNTQVTITPAGCHPHDVRPPKMARSVSHKPSVADIQRIYPGVTVLGDVDFSRIPSLFIEMQEMMSDRVQREIEEAGISTMDLQRLEVEAQLLREAEPFYLQDDSQWQIFKFNGIVNGSSKKCNAIPNPASIARIIAETNDMYNGSNEERKHVMEGQYSGVGKLATSSVSTETTDGTPTDTDQLVRTTIRCQDFFCT